MNHQDNFDLTMPQSPTDLKAFFLSLSAKPWMILPDIPCVWLKVGQSAKPADATLG